MASEYVQIDVTFPDGATDEVVDNYVRNDVARFIRDSAKSEVPLSVIVVKDDTATTPGEDEQCSDPVDTPVVSAAQCTEFVYICSASMYVVMGDGGIDDEELKIMPLFCAFC